MRMSFLKENDDVDHLKSRALRTTGKARDKGVILFFFALAER